MIDIFIILIYSTTSFKYVILMYASTYYIMTLTLR